MALALYLQPCSHAMVARRQFAQRHPATAQSTPLRHVGIYGYRVGFLHAFPLLEPRLPLERIEALEQMRALWHGHRIAVHLTSEAPGPGVDTPEDLERVRRLSETGSGGGVPRKLLQRGACYPLWEQRAKNLSAATGTAARRIHTIRGHP
jgi:hypothetical protein